MTTPSIPQENETPRQKAIREIHDQYLRERRDVETAYHRALKEIDQLYPEDDKAARDE